MATKIIVIDGPIGQYSFSQQFMRNELSGQSKNPALIKISSLGGSVDDALNFGAEDIATNLELNE